MVYNHETDGARILPVDTSLADRDATEGTLEQRVVRELGERMPWMRFHTDGTNIISQERLLVDWKFGSYTREGGRQVYKDPVGELEVACPHLEAISRILPKCQPHALFNSRYFESVASSTDIGDPGSRVRWGSGSLDAMGDRGLVGVVNDSKGWPRPVLGAICAGVARATHEVVAQEIKKDIDTQLENSPTLRERQRKRSEIEELESKLAELNITLDGQRKTVESTKVTYASERSRIDTITTGNKAKISEVLGIYARNCAVKDPGHPNVERYYLDPRAVMRGISSKGVLGGMFGRNRTTYTLFEAGDVLDGIFSVTNEEDSLLRQLYRDSLSERSKSMSARGITTERLITAVDHILPEEYRGVFMEKLNLYRSSRKKSEGLVDEEGIRINALVLLDIAMHLPAQLRLVSNVEDEAIRNSFKGHQLISPEDRSKLSASEHSSQVASNDMHQTEEQLTQTRWGISKLAREIATVEEEEKEEIMRSALENYSRVMRLPAIVSQRAFVEMKGIRTPDEFIKNLSNYLGESELILKNLISTANTLPHNLAPIHDGYFHIQTWEFSEETRNRLKAGGWTWPLEEMVGRWFFAEGLRSEDEITRNTAEEKRKAVALLLVASSFGNDMAIRTYARTKLVIPPNESQHLVEQLNSARVVYGENYRQRVLEAVPSLIPRSGEPTQPGEPPNYPETPTEAVDRVIRTKEMGLAVTVINKSTPGDMRQKLYDSLSTFMRIGGRTYTKAPGQAKFTDLVLTANTPLGSDNDNYLIAFAV